jgi:hypothetical protein
MLIEEVRRDALPTRHSVTGYDQPVPPGQKPFDHRSPHPLVPFRPLEDGYRFDRNESGQQKKTAPVSTTGSCFGRRASDCHRVRSGSPFAIAGSFLGRQTRGVHFNEDLASGVRPSRHTRYSFAIKSVPINSAWNLILAGCWKMKVKRSPCPRNEPFALLPSFPSRTCHHRRRRRSPA